MRHIYTHTCKHAIILIPRDVAEPVIVKKNHCSTKSLINKIDLIKTHTPPPTHTQRHARNTTRHNGTIAAPRSEKPGRARRQRQTSRQHGVRLSRPRSLPLVRKGSRGSFPVAYSTSFLLLFPSPSSYFHHHSFPLEFHFVVLPRLFRCSLFLIFSHYLPFVIRKPETSNATIGMS